ncbi:MAG: hypothetical protein R3B91_19865 [Planctomycetaceae bacterium]
MVNLLEAVDRPETVGFQADLAHTYLYLLGYNAPEHALLQKGYSDEEFWAAYKTMTDALRPWTIGLPCRSERRRRPRHGLARQDGQHCPADDPNGKPDIVNAPATGSTGPRTEVSSTSAGTAACSNDMLETPATWNTILDTMIKVRAHGWG